MCCEWTPGGRSLFELYVVQQKRAFVEAVGSLVVAREHRRQRRRIRQRGLINSDHGADRAALRRGCEGRGEVTVNEAELVSAAAMTASAADK